MIGSLFFLALTSFVGLSCAVPLMYQAQIHQNEVNMVAWDDVNSYTSTIQYLDLDFYGLPFHANVFLKDWEFDVDENANHFTIFGFDDGFNMVDSNSSTLLDADEVNTFMTDNECLFAFNVATLSSSKMVYITPYWNYLKINDFYNDTILFRFKEAINYNPFVDSFVLLNGVRVSNFDGNDTFGFTDHFRSVLPLNNSYKYVGGNFTLVYQLTNYDDQPTFHFAIGSYMLDDPNYFYSYQEGYYDGRADGYIEGQTYGESIGYQSGYTTGYNTGLSDGLNMAQTSNFNSLFNAIADTPVVFMRSLFGFELFGMNVFAIIMSLITGLIVIYVIKKVWK